eukprot:CAMPEP_0180235464 /NCGR_PEP_ID=MMETSP0987-20121128/29228_1 /TAXON_ID=697907 /ORGANISM="non described non described, Strain CCMP2293" /LENGTH=135 /DNA_ID=CAMNT_0022201561 /DNA_START=153 /DNA_END=560 /DNA_ORIENTATION=+
MVKVEYAGTNPTDGGSGASRTCSRVKGLERLSHLLVTKKNETMVEPMWKDSANSENLSVGAWQPASSLHRSNNDNQHDRHAQAIVKLPCWVCSTNPSTLDQGFRVFGVRFRGQCLKAAVGGIAGHFFPLATRSSL